MSRRKIYYRSSCYTKVLKPKCSSPLSPLRVLDRTVVASTAIMTPSSLLLSSPSFVSPPGVDSSLVQQLDTMSSATCSVISRFSVGISILNENIPPSNNTAAEVSNIFSIDGLLAAIRNLISEDITFVQSKLANTACVLSAATATSINSLILRTGFWEGTCPSPIPLLLLPPDAVTSFDFSNASVLKFKVALCSNRSPSLESCDGFVIFQICKHPLLCNGCKLLAAKQVKKLATFTDSTT